MVLYLFASCCTDADNSNQNGNNSPASSRSDSLKTQLSFGIQHESYTKGISSEQFTASGQSRGMHQGHQLGAVHGVRSVATATTY